ncbi:MAG TPA: TonB-dependent receptor [Rhodocyclaceae bacterium]|nr:TonB-dependent receptor [Rhodocyclaceae bacterium]
MKLRLGPSALAVAAAFPFQVSSVFADEPVAQAVVVTATRIEISDVDAPYASEVHLRDAIERSGATTLYDYLSRHTSIQVLPSYGNRFTPSLDMRGYGIENGHQNLVVALNGRRLNNIDMVPQLIGSIPLADVERIEITRGSGSVLHGDGAMAGTISIFTRAHEGVTIQAQAGSHGLRGGAIAAGFAHDRLSLSAVADRSSHDGFGKRDATGKRDESQSESWRVDATLAATESFKLDLDASSARIDTRYVEPLTLAQFRADPSQSSGVPYSHQKYRSDTWGAGAVLQLAGPLSLIARHDHEDKRSEFVNWAFKSDYVYRSSEISVQYSDGAVHLNTGVQTFDGVRKSAFDKTSKNDLGWFVQGQYEFDRLILSAGARTARIDYVYKPIAGASLKDDLRLFAWDLGANFRISDTLSAFGNLNRAYHAPDIDRFFSGGSFNAFIEPATAHTLTLGVNHQTAASQLKLSAFYARLKNEIYYFDTGNWLTSYNTNIDRSHKYGFELQGTMQLMPRVSGSLNYAWTKAIVDREDEGSGAFNGKDLPGVPRHSLILGVDVRVSDAGNLHLSQTWRSRAWAASDFANAGSQKQKAYRSTDVTYRHRFKDLELSAGVSNLLRDRNGLWVADDVIYPVDFERTWTIGMRLSF